MPRRSSSLQIFSLSFLDLIFCAMAGILVLYSISDPPSRRQPPTQPPTLIEVNFPESVGQVAFRVALENGTRRYAGMNGEFNSPWLFSDDPLSATLRLDEEVEGGAKLKVSLFDFELGLAMPNDDVYVRVMILAPSGGSIASGNTATRELALTASNGYSAEISLK